MRDYDSPWKEALDRYFEAFMAFFFPLGHAEIDWRRGYEMLDKELQQIVPEAEQGRRLVDKLVKVWRTNGQEEWILIHIEVQSQEDPDFALRMYVYNYRLFDRHNRKVVSLAVLGDERGSWRPSWFGYNLWGCLVDFHFPIVKLLDYVPVVPALESNSNPFATAVLAHLKSQETRQDPNERRIWKMRIVKGLYERGSDREDIRQLFRFIDWMMDLPADLTNEFWQEVYHYEEEKNMPYVTSVERIGIKKGLLEGLLAGIEQCLKLKFGPDGMHILPQIREVEDPDKLRTVLQAIDSAASLDDLRRVIAS